MIVKRYYDDKLAQASYLVGSATTGEALVIDPNRAVEQYIKDAAAEELRITHVTETHIHADFVSGVRELAARTGARVYLSDEGGPDWQYGFAAADGAVLLKDGAEFRVGSVRVRAIHTPGHTPEHLSFMITDTAGADQPMGVFTGDFIFVGDVGRPDLLEKAAGVAGTMAAGAQQLYQSLQRFRDLPEWLQLWPGHGAGSACGKSLGAVPSTTLGYEKLFNWAFSVQDEEEFVAAVLAGQPDPPSYFAEMKRINRDGPRVLGNLRPPPQLEAARLRELVAQRAYIVDTRKWAEYRKGFVPGTINIPLNRSFTKWAGWLMPYDRDVYLIVDDAVEARLEEAVRDLAMIGLDRIGGWFNVSAVEELAKSGVQLQRLEDMSAAEAAALVAAGKADVVDVRNESEWQAGHIPDVPNIPLGHLRERLNEVPTGRQLIMQCRTGSRSGIAASLMAAHGITNVVNLAGGIRGWEEGGHPVERGAEVESTD